MITLLLCPVFAFAPPSKPRSSVTITVDGSTVLHTLPARFVSFTMDAGFAGHSLPFSEAEFWENATARALAAHLSPAVFRFGGTSEDYMQYEFGSDASTAPGTTCDKLLPAPTRTCIKLNATQFDVIAAFTRAVGWDFVFGANVGTARDASTNVWQPAQLESLLKHATAAKIELYGVELGNEPDLMCAGPQGQRFSCHHAPPNTSWPDAKALSPKQLAADYAPFAALVHKHQPQAKVIGNDVADDLTRYATQFLGNLSRPLDAFSYHFYYGPGSSRPHGLNASQFSTPAVLDKFLKVASEAAGVAKARAAGAALWLGETSSTYGGGTANASASFVAGFMWLDKLGLAAQLGHSLVARQTFADSAYSVIGYDARPNPDYWTTVLWKRLVGPAVLGVADLLEEGREVRAYAFCAAAGAAAAAAGAVTLAVLNTKAKDVELELELGAGETAGPVDLYWLTSFPGLLTSRDVFLNGAPLALADVASGALPPLPPKRLAAGAPLMLPPKSYGFVVLPEAGAARCGSVEP